MFERIVEALADIWETIYDFISDHFEGIIGAVLILIIGGLLIGVLAADFDNTRNEIAEGEIIDKWVSKRRTYFTISGVKDGEPYEDTFEVTEAEYAAYKIGDWYER